MFNHVEDVHFYGLLDAFCCMYNFHISPNNSFFAFLMSLGIIKSGTKQAQTDMVRLFKSDGLVRQNYHLIHKKSAKSFNPV